MDQITSPAATPRRIAVALATVYLAWGCSFPAIRATVHVLPPLLVMGMRFLLAGTLLAGWHAWRSGDAPGVRARIREARQASSLPGLRSAMVAGTGLVGVGMGLTSVAEQHVPAGVAALLAATASLWMVGIAWLTFGERPARRTVAGLLLGTLGVAVLVVGGSSSGGIGSPAGIAMMLASAVAWAAASLHGSRTSHRLPGLLHAGVQMAWGGLLLLGMGIAGGDLGRLHLAAISPGIAMSLLFLVFGASIGGYSAYNWLLAHVPAQMAATHTYVNPVVAIVVGAVALGEQVAASTIVALALVLGAVLLLVRSNGAQVAVGDGDGSVAGVAELAADLRREARPHEVPGVLDQLAHHGLGQRAVQRHGDPVALVHVVAGPNRRRVLVSKRSGERRLALEIDAGGGDGREGEQLADDAPYVRVRTEWPVVGGAGERSAQRIELASIHRLRPSRRGSLVSRMTVTGVA